MPRSPFIPLISLPFYWSWQHFHTIMAMLIDSHFLLLKQNHQTQQKEENWINSEEERKGKNMLLCFFLSYFCHQELAFLFQALPNGSQPFCILSTKKHWGCFFAIIYSYVGCTTVIAKLFLWAHDVKRPFSNQPVIIPSMFSEIKIPS